MIYSNKGRHTAKRMPPVGTGERFAMLEKKIAKNPKVKNPKAVVASIGIKKYGKKKVLALAKKGRKNANKA